jgi:hypothetical protein
VEKSFLQIPRSFLEETVHSLREDVQRMLVEQVFGPDDVVISPWEDRKSQNVVVP